MKLVPSFLSDTDYSNLRDATYWLVYSLLGGLAPIWCGVIISKILSHPPTLGQFTAHGEFALYTAAIVAPAFHTLSRDLKVPGFKGRQFFLLASVCCMVIAVCIYVAVSCAQIPGLMLAIGTIDQEFLRFFTPLLFVFAMGLAFIVTVLDYGRLSSDVREVVVEQRQELKDEFNKLKD
jgi:hypothetical protein